MPVKHKKFGLFFKTVIWTILVAFSFNLIVPPGLASAQMMPQAILGLPVPGSMITGSPAYTPPMMVGMTIHPENPLKFDFVIDTGDDQLNGEALQVESKKLINYFLTTLTVPEDKLWVNLSPYEKNRIIPNELSVTEMGRDMLSQDYLLKQLTASLMYPEDELGEKFWQRVRRKALEQYGTIEVPTNTFNKVWIVPEFAHVYVNDGSVFVVDSHLNVMLEEDYLALEGHNAEKAQDKETMDESTKEIIRQILIPEIEREINTGKHFANLRQIYNSMILATWYKKNLRESALGQMYIDQNLVKGVDHVDPNIKEKIYQQYIEAFKKGVFNYIKEDMDPATERPVPRKYFSGGVTGIDQAQIGEVLGVGPEYLAQRERVKMEVRLETVGGVSDQAMTAESDVDLKAVLTQFMPDTRIPGRTQLGQFQIVSTPWRKQKRMPAKPFSSVVMPFNEADFHYRAPKDKNVVDWDFDERDIFWEGELEGSSVAFLAQKWPYALNHFLIVPERQANHPQVLESKYLELMHRYVLQQPLEDFRITFNSLKAGASINHLHFHGFTIEKGSSALENAVTRELFMSDDVQVSRVEGYGANALFFSTDNKGNVAGKAYEYINALQQFNTAHTIIISPQGIYVLPVESNFITSFGNTWTFYEMMGFILKLNEDQDISNITETNIIDEMRRVSLSEDAFAATYKKAFKDEAVIADDDARDAKIARARVLDIPSTSYATRYDPLIQWLIQNPYVSLDTLAKGTSIVDVGAGHGYGSLAIAKKMAAINPSSAIYGIDRKDLVGRFEGSSILQDEAKSLGNLTYVQGDHQFRNAQIPKTGIKIITSLNVWMYHTAENRMRAIAEMSAKLDEGGLLIIGNNGITTATRGLNFVVLQKKENRLVPREFVFGHIHTLKHPNPISQSLQGLMPSSFVNQFLSSRLRNNRIKELIKYRLSLFKKYGIERAFEEAVIVNRQILDEQQLLLEERGLNVKRISEDMISISLDPYLEAEQPAKVVEPDQAMFTQPIRYVTITQHQIQTLAQAIADKTYVGKKLPFDRILRSLNDSRIYLQLGTQIDINVDVAVDNMYVHSGEKIQKQTIRRDIIHSLPAIGIKIDAAMLGGFKFTGRGIALAGVMSAVLLIPSDTAQYPRQRTPLQPTSTPKAPAGAKKFKLQKFFVGPWSSITPIAVTKPGEYASAMENVLRQANAIDPKLAAVLRPALEENIDFTNIIDRETLNAQWAQFNRDFFIPNGLYAEIQVADNQTNTRQLLGIFIHAIKRRSPIKVNGRPGETLLVERVDTFRGRQPIAAQAPPGLDAIVIWDNVFTNVAQTVKMIELGQGTILNAPEIMNQWMRDHFRGMNIDQIKAILIKDTRRHELAHKIDEEHGITKNIAYQFGLTAEEWQGLSRENRRQLKWEIYADLVAMTQSDDARIFAVKKMDVLADPRPGRYTYTFRFIMQNLLGNPRHQWTALNDVEGNKRDMERIMRDSTLSQKASVLLKQYFPKFDPKYLKDNGMLAYVIESPEDVNLAIQFLRDYKNAMGRSDALARQIRVPREDGSIHLYVGDELYLVENKINDPAGEAGDLIFFNQDKDALNLNIGDTVYQIQRQKRTFNVSEIDRRDIDIARNDADEIRILLRNKGRQEFLGIIGDMLDELSKSEDSRSEDQLNTIYYRLIYGIQQPELSSGTYVELDDREEFEKQRLRVRNDINLTAVLNDGQVDAGAQELFDTQVGNFRIMDYRLFSPTDDAEQVRSIKAWKLKETGEHVIRVEFTNDALMTIELSEFVPKAFFRFLLMNAILESDADVPEEVDPVDWLAARKKMEISEFLQKVFELSEVYTEQVNLGRRPNKVKQEFQRLFPPQNRKSILAKYFERLDSQQNELIGRIVESNHDEGIKQGVLALLHDQYMALDPENKIQVNMHFMRAFQEAGFENRQSVMILMLIWLNSFLTEDHFSDDLKGLVGEVQKAVSTEPGLMFTVAQPTSSAKNAAGKPLPEWEARTQGVSPTLRNQMQMMGFRFDVRGVTVPTYILKPELLQTGNYTDLMAFLIHHLYGTIQLIRPQLPGITQLNQPSVYQVTSLGDTFTQLHATKLTIKTLTQMLQHPLFTDKYPDVAHGLIKSLQYQKNMLKGLQVELGLSDTDQAMVGETDDLARAQRIEQFDTQMQKKIEKIGEKLGRKDIIVGIPFYDETDNIAALSRGIQQKLQTLFGDTNGGAVVVMGEAHNAQALNAVPTIDSTADFPIIAAVKPEGFTRKPWSERTFMKIAQQSGAHFVSIDADIDQQDAQAWIELLSKPLIDGEADFAAPHAHRRFDTDDAAVHLLDYLVGSSFYGYKLRQRHGGEFAIAHDKLSELIADPTIRYENTCCVEGELSARAALANYRVAEVNLGEKMQSSLNLDQITGRMRTVLSSVFMEMEHHLPLDRADQLIDVPLIGDALPDIAMSELLPSSMINPWSAQISEELARHDYSALFTGQELNIDNVINIGKSTAGLTAAQWAQLTRQFFQAYVFEQDGDTKAKIIAAYVPIWLAGIVGFARQSEGISFNESQQIIASQYLPAFDTEFRQNLQDEAMTATVEEYTEKRLKLSRVLSTSEIEDRRLISLEDIEFRKNYDAWGGIESVDLFFQYKELERMAFAVEEQLRDTLHAKHLLPELDDWLRDALTEIIGNSMRSIFQKYGKDILAAELIIRAYTQDGKVNFEVLDNGHGLTLDELEKVSYEPYSSSDGGLDFWGGRGLGLYELRQDLEEGAELKIANRKDVEGVIVTLSIPIDFKLIAAYKHDEAIFGEVKDRVNQIIRRDAAFPGIGTEHLPDYLYDFQQDLLQRRPSAEEEFIKTLIEGSDILSVTPQTPLFIGAPLTPENPVVWGNDSQLFMHPTRSIHLYPGDVRFKSSGGAYLAEETELGNLPYRVTKEVARARSIMFGANEQNLQQEMNQALSFAYLMETLWPDDGYLATNIPVGIKRMKTISVEGETYSVKEYFRLLTQRDPKVTKYMEQFLYRRLAEKRDELPADTVEAYITFIRPAQMLDMHSSPYRLGLLRRMLLEDFSTGHEFEVEVRERWQRWGIQLEGLSPDEIAIKAKDLVDNIFAEIMKDYRSLDIPVTNIKKDGDTAYAIFYQALQDYRQQTLFHNLLVAERFYKDTLRDLGRYLGALWTIGGRTQVGPIDERNVAVRNNRIILHDWDEGFVPNRETISIDISLKEIYMDFDWTKTWTLSTIQKLLGVSDHFSTYGEEYFMEGIEEGRRLTVERILLNPDQQVISDINRRLLIIDWQNLEERSVSYIANPKNEKKERNKFYAHNFVLGINELLRGEVVHMTSSDTPQDSAMLAQATAKIKEDQAMTASSSNISGVQGNEVQPPSTDVLKSQRDSRDQLLVVMATRNQRKQNEWREYFSNDPTIKLVTLDEIGLDDIEDADEVGVAYRDIALSKARIVSEQLVERTSEPFYVIAEDSGIEVEALGGNPGIFTMRYANADAQYEGLRKESPVKAVIKKIMDELGQVSEELRTVYARGAMVLINASGQEQVIESVVKGKVPASVNLESVDGTSFHPIIMMAPGKSYLEMDVSERAVNPSLSAKLFNTARRYFADEKDRLATSKDAGWQARALDDYHSVMADTSTQLDQITTDTVNISIANNMMWGSLKIDGSSSKPIAVFTPDLAERKILLTVQPLDVSGRFIEHLRETVIPLVESTLLQGGWHLVYALPKVASQRSIPVEYQRGMGSEIAFLANGAVRLRPSDYAEPSIQRYEVDMDGHYAGFVELERDLYGQWIVKKISRHHSMAQKTEYWALIEEWMGQAVGYARKQTLDSIQPEDKASNIAAEQLVERTEEFQQQFMDKVNQRIQQLVAEGRWFYYYKDHFITDSILDFVGYGEPRDNFNDAEKDERRRISFNYLTKVAAHPEIHDAFWAHIDRYYVQITDRDRNAPLFIAAANFLSGRRLDQNDIVQVESVLNRNNTIRQHPWYGEKEQEEKASRMRALPFQKRDKVKILLIGGAERFGLNQKAVYLRDIIREAIGEDSDIEIIVNDITFQQEIYTYDEAGDRFEQTKVFDFDHNGQWRDPDSGIIFRKVELDNPRQNIASDPEIYDSNEKFDVVINARVAIQYFRDPVALENMKVNGQNHLKESGLYIYDTAEVDRGDMYYNDRIQGPVYAGSIPFRDLLVLDKDLAGLFDTLGFRSQVIQDAYRLAYKNIDINRADLVYKRILVSLLAERIKDPYYLAAVLLMDVDISQITASFPHVIRRAILQNRHFDLFDSEFEPKAILATAYQSDDHKNLVFWKNSLVRMDSLPERSSFVSENELFTNQHIGIEVGTINDRAAFKIKDRDGETYISVDQAMIAKERSLHMDEAILVTDDEHFEELQRLALPKFDPIDVIESDSAMQAKEKGGIDFNPVNMQFKQQGESIKMDMDAGILIPTSPIEGLRPVIIQTTPITNFPFLLGLTDDRDAPMATTEPEDSSENGRFSSISPADRRSRLHLSHI